MQATPTPSRPTLPGGAASLPLSARAAAGSPGPGAGHAGHAAAGLSAGRKTAGPAASTATGKPASGALPVPAVASQPAVPRFAPPALPPRPSSSAPLSVPIPFVESIGYCPDHVQGRFSERQAKAIKFIRERLAADGATLKNRRAVRNNFHALQWIVERAAEAMEEAGVDLGGGAPPL